MAKAIFHPQAWVNDHAIEVDPEGETEWDVGDVSHDLKGSTYESDELRFHSNAPAWVREWSGPFYIEIDRDTSQAIDWEKIARDNGWSVVDLDPSPHRIHSEPCLYHEQLDRIWPLGDWEGAVRDLGLTEIEESV